MFVLGFEIRTGPQLIRVDITVKHPTIAAERISVLDISEFAIPATVTELCILVLVMMMFASSLIV
jgi:hypothetical protein